MLEIVCEACGERDRPASVWQSGDRVALECRRCGHLNRVDDDDRRDGDDGDADGSRPGDDDAGAERDPAPLTDPAPPGARDHDDEDHAAPAADRATHDDVTSRGGGDDRAVSDDTDGQDDDARGQDPDVAATTTRQARDAAASRDGDAPPGADHATRDAPPIQCPKCAHRQRADEACDRCGFVFANHRPGEMPWDRPPDGDEDAWDRAHALWDDVVDAPDDPARHDAFVQHCRAHQLLDLASRCYRFRLADHPDDDLARQRLDAMLTLEHEVLLTQLDRHRDHERGEISRLRQSLLWGVFFAAILCGLLFFLAYPNLFS